MKRSDQIKIINDCIDTLNLSAIAHPQLGFIPLAVWHIVSELVCEALEDTFKDDRFREGGLSDE